MRFIKATGLQEDNKDKKNVELLCNKWGIWVETPWKGYVYSLSAGKRVENPSRHRTSREKEW